MKGNFQIIMIVVFMAAAIFGILVFSGMIKIGNDKNIAGSAGTVTLWGTERSQTFSKVLQSFNKANPTFIVKYVQKNKETFDTDLIEAIALGKGPDMYFLSNDLAFKYSDKIYTIPYTSFPVTTFKSTFVKAGETFLTSKGILALPITVDPMVMYYNRTVLDSNNIVYPPATWDEFQNLVPILTRKDDSSKIIKSAVALGQFSNVSHAKDILSTLFMQLGNPIVVEKNGRFSSVLDQGSGKNDLSSVLKFYTDFSDPLKSVYSWNRSLNLSQDEFSAENLAFYFGFASEYPLLVKKNPNQNFSITTMPQIKDTDFKFTYSHVTGIAISSFSKNFTTAFTAASLLATSDFAGQYVKAIGAIPARRSLLAVKQTEAFSPIFYSSALFAGSWLDPSTDDSDNIFRLMVDDVLSGNLTVRQSIDGANNKLTRLFMN